MKKFYVTTHRSAILFVQGGAREAKRMQENSTSHTHRPIKHTTRTPT
jgi:hypothetical protein